MKKNFPPSHSPFVSANPAPEVPAITVDHLIECASAAAKNIRKTEEEYDDQSRCAREFLVEVVVAIAVRYGVDLADKFCHAAGFGYLASKGRGGEKQNSSEESSGKDVKTETPAASSGASGGDSDDQGHVICKKCSAIAPIIGSFFCGDDGGALCARCGQEEEQRAMLHGEEIPGEESDHCAHNWVYTGTAYGGDDPRWMGEGRCYCSHCGADGDA